MNWITCWWTEITWSTFHDRQMTIQIKKSGCKAPSSPSLSMDHSRVKVPRNAQHHNANPRPNRRLGNWPQKVADTQQALQSSKFLYQKSNVWHVSSIISCFQSWHNQPQFLLIPNHFNKKNPSAMQLAFYVSRTSTFWPPSHHILSPTIAHEAGRLQLSHIRIHELISRFSIFPPEKMTTKVTWTMKYWWGFYDRILWWAHLHPQPKWVV